MQDSLFNFLYKAYYVCKVISVGTPIRRFPYVHMAKGPHALMPMHPDGWTDMHTCVLVGTYLHRYDDLFLQKFTMPLAAPPPHTHKKHTHTHTHTHTHIYIYICICICAYIHAHVPTRIFIYIYIYIYLYHPEIIRKIIIRLCKQ